MLKAGLEAGSASTDAEDCCSCFGDLAQNVAPGCCGGNLILSFQVCIFLEKAYALKANFHLQQNDFFHSVATSFPLCFLPSTGSDNALPQSNC